MTYNQTLQQNKSIAALSPKERKACLKALAHLSRLDGYVDDDEKAFIADMAQVYDTAPDPDLYDPQPEDAVLEELTQIDNRAAALQLIKDLCFLGHADDNLSPEEVLFIGHAGLSMGIEIEKIEQISDWVVDRIIWQERGKLIMELSDTQENDHAE